MHEDWANQMVGEARYQLSAYTHDRAKSGKLSQRQINSRKWAESECGIQIGENGEDWKTISISQWRLCIEDSFSKNVLVNSYELYEILTGHSREEVNPRMKLRIGTTGNAGVASISANVEAIEGIAGRRSIVGANEALSARGLLTEITLPDYGYVRSSVILHEGMDFILYIDWVGGDLDELTYTDRQGGERKLMVIHMPTAMVFASVPHEVYERSRIERRYLG